MSVPVSTVVRDDRRVFRELDRRALDMRLVNGLELVGDFLQDAPFQRLLPVEERNFRALVVEVVATHPRAERVRREVGKGGPFEHELFALLVEFHNAVSRPHVQKERVVDDGISI